MCPAAQRRRETPVTAIAPPSQSDLRDGCMSSRNTTPRAVPTGTRNLCASLPQMCMASILLLGFFVHDRSLPSERRGQPFLGLRLGAESVVFSVQRLVVLG